MFRWLVSDLMDKKTLPLVSIVGRPNVGKSTLFNRLIGRRVAIVDDSSGVTRDRIFAKCRIGAADVYIVDTGGLTAGAGKSEMERNIEKQILMSFESSAALVFVVDSATGLMPEDREVAAVLRRYGKPVVLAANKAESRRTAQGASEFFELGFGEPLTVSALHGDNIDALKERISELIPEEAAEPREEQPIRFCVVGRPNVGKSSIANAILGEERCVVSDVPGTTRDMVDTEFARGGRAFVIVDTAGLKRRKSKMDRLEFYGATRTRRAIEGADVAVLVLDARDGLLEGDKRIISAVIELKRGLVIAVNKMDLIEDPVYDNFLKHLEKEAPFLMPSPVLFVSALEGRGMDELFESLVLVHGRLNSPLPIELLKNVICDVRALYSPRSSGGRVGAIKDVIHDRVNPPRVVVKVNDPDLFAPAYVKLIENRIRGVFDLEGVPLDLKLVGAPDRGHGKKSKR